MLLKCHIGFRGEAHSSSCRQAEGQEGHCCCKRDDDVDLRRLRQTMRLAHWSVCPSQVAPMTRGSVDLDDSVHRVCICVLDTPPTLHKFIYSFILLSTREYGRRKWSKWSRAGLGTDLCLPKWGCTLAPPGEYG